jgi:rubrerythrin
MADVLDRTAHPEWHPMLYGELFDRLERARWELRTHVPYDQIDRSKLSDQWIRDLRSICLTELSALYATEMFLRDFYADIDFCSFISVWFYEEMKHYLTLRRYLETVGETFDDAELPRLRLTFDEGPAIETLTMHFVGEQRLAHWYTAFSNNLEEPVLALIFKTLAADELRHAAAYAKYLRKAVTNEPSVLPNILKMALWMLRSTNDAPKHPTTITDPSVVGLLDEPDYVKRMLNTYLPDRDHEAPVQRRVLALMGELAGTPIESVKALLPAIRKFDPGTAAVSAA